MSLLMWLFSITLIVAPVIVLHIWITGLKRRTHKLCGHYLHSLPQIPIFGNALILAGVKNTTEIWQFIIENCNKYPQGAIFWVFHIAWIFIQEIDVVEAVFTSSVSTEKSYVYSLLDTITEGVFNAKGEKWKRLRKKLNSTFQSKQMDFYFDDANEQTAICVKILEKNANKQINVQSFLTTYFMDVVFRTHFGVESFEQTNRKYCITECAAIIIELTMKNRFFNVLVHPMALFKLTRVYGYINHAREAPINYIRKLIAKRMNEANYEKETGLYNRDPKKIFYVDMVKDVLFDLKIPATIANIERCSADMLIAASDTTSIAASSVLYMIAAFPEIQEKVYLESRTILNDKEVKDITKDDLKKMTYLEMVIKETLRHVCPPGIVRELSHDLNVGKYIIPKGTNVYIVIKAIHMNPNYYEKPDEFYPEHFSPEQTSKRPKYAFLPFSYGPRNCPGQEFTYITMKMLLSAIVRKFKIETNIPLKDIKYKMALMQEHIGGYMVKLIPR